jgi:hypothetical protein
MIRIENRVASPFSAENMNYGPANIFAVKSALPIAVMF